MSTLFLSDLDGTLLRNDQRTSAFTNETVNRLVGKGVYFSYATARSSITAKKATAGIRVNLPLIVYNGAFVVENNTGNCLFTNFFQQDTAFSILRDLLAQEVSPIVYSYCSGIERFTYDAAHSSTAVLDFVRSRGCDPRKTTVGSSAELFGDGIFYFTCIDAAEKLAPLYQKYKEEHHCLFYKDLYSGEQWLEIMPKSVSKAKAARQLASYLGCEKIVAFGDAKNDLELFAAADECYCVANAVPELKAIATGVIGSNEEDGVAKWLLENYSRY